MAGGENQIQLQDGVESDAFRDRMECQCDRIEEYRRSIMDTDGRVLTSDEAALEWIELYAEDFASEFPLTLD
ncbi:MAG: hypothetical protein AAGA91_00755 [Pseudomonadota bacterium]